MEKNFFNKSDFLYSKNNSITKELSQEIIEEFEKDSIDNPFLFINNENETILDIPNNKKYTFYYKLKSLLISELKKNIELYKNRFNNVLYFNKENNYEQPFFPFCHNQFDMNTSIIIKKKMMNTQSNICLINKKNMVNKEEQLSFVWFLNDCHYDLVFWNEYQVPSSVGKLFIFPISWCFPYEEIGLMNTEQYIITGFI